MGLFGKKEETQSTPAPQPAPAENKGTKDAEIAAAIGMALSLYLTEIHDHEKMVLTINQIMRPYSPWSSKIYGLRKYPRS